MKANTLKALWRKSKIVAITDSLLFLIVLFFGWVILKEPISLELKAGLEGLALVLLINVGADLQRASDMQKIDKILDTLKDIQDRIGTSQTK